MKCCEGRKRPQKLLDNYRNPAENVCCNVNYEYTAIVQYPGISIFILTIYKKNLATLLLRFLTLYLDAKLLPNL